MGVLNEEVLSFPSMQNSSLHMATFSSLHRGYAVTLQQGTTNQVIALDKFNVANWKSSILFSSTESSIHHLNTLPDDSILVSGTFVGSLFVEDSIPHPIHSDTPSIFIIKYNSKKQISFIKFISVENPQHLINFSLHCSSQYFYILTQFSGKLQRISTLSGSTKELSIHPMDVELQESSCSLLQFSTQGEGKFIRLKNLESSCLHSYLSMQENFVVTATYNTQNNVIVSAFDSNLSTILSREMELLHQQDSLVSLSLRAFPHTILLAATIQQETQKMTRVFQWKITRLNEKPKESTIRHNSIVVDVSLQNSDPILIMKDELCGLSLVEVSTEKRLQIASEKCNEEFLASQWNQQNQVALFTLQNNKLWKKMIDLSPTIQRQQQQTTFEVSQTVSKLGCQAGRYFTRRDAPFVLQSNILSASNTSRAIISVSSMTTTPSAMYTVGEFTDTILMTQNGNPLSSRGEKDVFITNSIISITTVDVITWILQIGGPLNDTVSKIRPLNDTSVIVVGSFAGTCQFGNTLSLTTTTPNSMFMTRIATNGSIIFTKTTSTSSTSTATALGESNNMYIVGGLFKDTLLFDNSATSLTSVVGLENGYLGYFTADGNNIWLKQITSTMKLDIKHVTIASDSNLFIVGGEFIGTIDLGNGNTFTSQTNMQEVFLAAYSLTTRNVVWSKRIRGSQPFSLMDISIDLDSNLFISGSFSNTLDVCGISLTTTVPSATAASFARLSIVNGDGIWANRIQSESDTSYSVTGSVMRPDLLGNTFGLASYSHNSQQQLDYTQVLYWSPTGRSLSFSSTVRNITFTGTQGAAAQLYSSENVMSFVLAKKNTQSIMQYNGVATTSSAITNSKQDYMVVKFVSHACAACSRGTAKNFVSLNETCPVCPYGTYAPDFGASTCLVCDGFPINSQIDCLSLATFVGIIIGAAFVVVATILFIILTIALCIVQIVHERSSVSYQRTKAKSQMLLYD